MKVWYTSITHTHLTAKPMYPLSSTHNTGAHRHTETWTKILYINTVPSLWGKLDWWNSSALKLWVLFFPSRYSCPLHWSRFIGQAKALPHQSASSVPTPSSFPVVQGDLWMWQFAVPNICLLLLVFVWVCVCCLCVLLCTMHKHAPMTVCVCQVRCWK